MARAPRIPVPVAPAVVPPNAMNVGLGRIFVGAVILGAGCMVSTCGGFITGYTVGCNYRSKDVEQPKPVVVEQLAPTYLSRNALENKVNFGFNDKDSAYIIEIQNFENDGRISPLELKAAATYERRRRFQEPTNAWTREELDCLLQGERQWMAKTEDERAKSTFSRWYENDFTVKYDAFKIEKGVEIK